MNVQECESALMELGATETETNLYVTWLGTDNIESIINKAIGNDLQGFVTNEQALSEIRNQIAKRIRIPIMPLRSKGHNRIRANSLRSGSEVTTSDRKYIVRPNGQWQRVYAI